MYARAENRGCNQRQGAARVAATRAARPRVVLYYLADQLIDRPAAAGDLPYLLDGLTRESRWNGRVREWRERERKYYSFFFFLYRNSL